TQRQEHGEFVSQRRKCGSDTLVRPCWHFSRCAQFGQQCRSTFTCYHRAIEMSCSMRTLRAIRLWSILLTFVLLICCQSFVAGQDSTAKTANPPGSFEELSAQAGAAREAGKTNQAILLYQSALV